MYSVGIVGGLRTRDGTGKDRIVREEQGGNANVPRDHRVVGSAARGSAGSGGEDTEELPEEDEDAGITVDDDPSDEEDEE